MRLALHWHHWGPWEPTNLGTMVKRTCTRCRGFEYQGIWLLTERQLMRGH